MRRIRTGSFRQPSIPSREQTFSGVAIVVVYQCVIGFSISWSELLTDFQMLVGLVDLRQALRIHLRKDRRGQVAAVSAMSWDK